MSVFGKLPVFLLIQGIAIMASAQVYNSSISAAAGGTGRGAVEASDAVYLNSAALVHLKGHNITSSFAENQFAISISDNSEESSLPASFAYVQKDVDFPTSRYTEHNFMLALAEFARDKLSMGITGHYLEQRFEERNYYTPNIDVAILYTPTGSTGLGVIGYNLLGAPDSVPEFLRRKSSMAVGFNYIYRAMMRLGLEASTDSRVMTGLETFINRFVITRFGYQNHINDKRELLTAGLGFKGPRFAINYAYQGNTGNSGDYRHSVDLEIPF